LEVFVARKTRIRLSGVLQQLTRGPAIMTDGGETWIIELADGLELPESGTVLLEGIQAGLDRLKVDWIGQSNN
jgi:hypothetical protein